MTSTQSLAGRLLQFDALREAQGLLDIVTPRAEPDSDLKALSPLEFVTAIEQGQLRIGTSELLYAWGKIFLAAFLDGLTEAGFEEALVVARQG